MPVQPSLLPLGSLRPYTLIPGGTELEGTLVAVVPFNPTTGRASLDITQNNVRVQLGLCGPWAQSAVLSFFEHTGRRCRVSSVGGELLNVLVAGTSRDRNGDALPGGQKLCVEFKNGLQGWWKDRVTGVKSDEFRFMSAPPSTRSRLASKKADYCCARRRGRQGCARAAPARQARLVVRRARRSPSIASDGCATGLRLEDESPSTLADGHARSDTQAARPRDQSGEPVRRVRCGRIARQQEAHRFARGRLVFARQQWVEQSHQRLILARGEPGLEGDADAARAEARQGAEGNEDDLGAQNGMLLLFMAPHLNKRLIVVTRAGPTAVQVARPIQSAW